MRWPPALRHGDPPVIGRIAEGQLLLDLRTVPPGMGEVVLQAVQAALERTMTDEGRMTKDGSA